MYHDYHGNCGIFICNIVMPSRLYHEGSMKTPYTFAILHFVHAQIHILYNFIMYILYQLTVYRLRVFQGKKHDSHHNKYFQCQYCHVLSFGHSKRCCFCFFHLTFSAASKNIASWSLHKIVHKFVYEFVPGPASTSL